MSKERETLITDLSINAVDGFFYITQKLQSEIRELLTQKREPLSDEAIYDHCCAMDSSYTCNFIDGVEWAEQQHGIGGEDES